MRHIVKILLVVMVFLTGFTMIRPDFWGTFTIISNDRSDTLDMEWTDSSMTFDLRGVNYFIIDVDTVYHTGVTKTDSLLLGDSLVTLMFQGVIPDTTWVNANDDGTSASDVGSQIHDSLNNIHSIVFDTTDLGTKSDTFTIDLSKQINYVTIDDTVAINYSNAQSTTYLFIIEISGSNAKINWGTGWQAAGGSVSLTETDGIKILISAFYDIRNNKMIITEVDDVQDL